MDSRDRLMHLFQLHGTAWSFLSPGGTTLCYEHKPGKCKHGGPRLTALSDHDNILRLIASTP